MPDLYLPLPHPAPDASPLPLHSRHKKSHKIVLNASPRSSLQYHRTDNPFHTMSTSTPATTVQVYLNFEGRCEEAIEFYRGALGAEVEMMMRFKDAPADGQCAEGDGNKVMHSSFRIGGTTVMASDCHNAGNAAFQGFSLSLSVPSEAEANRLFAALSDGGKVEMPIAKTFFSPCFGVVADKFGVSWMVGVHPERV